MSLQKLERKIMYYVELINEKDLEKLGMKKENARAGHHLL